MSNKALGALVALTITIAAAAAADPSSTLLAGVSAGPAASSEAGAAADVVARMLASLAWGWRTPVPAGGFAAISASASLLADVAGSLESSQTLDLEARLGAGPGALLLDTRARASWLGDEPSFAPQARVGYRLEVAALEPSIHILGSWDARPEGNEDVITGGARLELRTSGSVRAAAEASAGGAVESWYETDVYDAAGNPSGESRRDLIADLRLELGGLAGYFTEWTLGVRGAGRFSNANRLAAVGVDDDSESRIELSAWGSLSWAPTSRASVRVSAEAAPSWYAGRQALDDAGAATGETLRTLDLRFGARAERAVGRNTWMVLEAGTLATLANDSGEECWSAEMRVGFESAF